MTRSEFSDEFDALLNSYATKIDFGDQVSVQDVALDEYEKSVFLTKAQEEYVIALYNGSNPLKTSFEETEEFRRYLANLVKESTQHPIESSNGYPIGVGSKSTFFTLPEDVWFITYESANLGDGVKKCDDMASISVVPVTQDEYHRIKKNPFRGPTNRRALRLDLADGVVEIVSSYPSIESYYVRYLRKPKPIILVSLTGTGLSINGETEPNTAEDGTDKTCELHEALHYKILESAVAMAVQSRTKATSNKKS